MRINFFQFVKKSLANFSEAVVNLFIFIPYFFSSTSLWKTLFSPWKNLVAIKTNRGFSLNLWLEQLSFNLISRAIGFIMRASIIIFSFMLLVTYILILPVIILILLIFLPIVFLKYCLEKTDQERKEVLKIEFVANHLLKPENLSKVNQWFEQNYAQLHLNRQWWKLKTLLSIPPLARDWAVGYTPLLDQYVDDLTNTTYQKKIITAYDREKEIAQIERTLSKSEETNVIIVGDEGVGKHTIVDSLAKKIYEGRVNNLLAYKRILKLNLEAVLNQSTDQKQRENLVEQLLAEACLSKNVVLLIENFDKFTASGPDRVDLTIPIEKYAKTNQLQIIAITQPFFYQKFIFPNQVISRLFEKVDVYEIKKEEAEKILLQKSLDFEKRYQLVIPYEIIQNVVDKSDFFITKIPFPEKAIALLDAVCVTSHEQGLTKITPNLVDKVLTEITHVPTSLTDQMKHKLVNLEIDLSTRVIQQPEAINKLSGALRRSFLLIGKRKKPLATFLFLGPTGVGKTETAKTISDLFFGSEKYLVRFDMSLYQSKSDIPNLIGSLESGNPGLLTRAIRENPYGVLLLDEIEKADKDLVNIFLTIVDEGYFTDGIGKRVDCKNLVIIATSNAGSDLIYKNQTLETRNLKLDDLPSNIQHQNPVSSLQRPASDIVDYLIEQKIFSPEFLNRFDDVIVYQPLSKNSIVQLAKKYLKRIADDIYKLYRVKISISDQFFQTLVDQGFDPKFGARNLERVIRNQVEAKVAKIILEGQAKEGQIIYL